MNQEEFNADMVERDPSAEDTADSLFGIFDKDNKHLWLDVFLFTFHIKCTEMLDMLSGFII